MHNLSSKESELAFAVYKKNSGNNDYTQIWYNTTEQGTYIYYSGEFNLPQEAASHMHSLISKGYQNAFVVTLTK